MALKHVNRRVKASDEFVFGSLCLSVAFIACGISFFGPFWLSNVMLSSNTIIEYNNSYLRVNITCPMNNRGLWGQCGTECQWFWENDYSLQKKFNELKWHLASQVLYSIGGFLVLFAEVYARVQICFRSNRILLQTLSFTLLVSFVIQGSAIAIFGGFSRRDYEAVGSRSVNTYFGWCFWMALGAACMTLVAGLIFFKGSLARPKDT